MSFSSPNLGGQSCLCSKLRRFLSTAHLFIWPQRTLFFFLPQKRPWPAEPKDSLDCILVTVFLLCSPYCRRRFFSASTAPDTELVVSPSHLLVCDVHSVRSIYLFFQRCRFLYSFLISAERRPNVGRHKQTGPGKDEKKKKEEVFGCVFFFLCGGRPFRLLGSLLYPWPVFVFLNCTAVMCLFIVAGEG